MQWNADTAYREFIRVAPHQILSVTNTNCRIFMAEVKYYACTYSNANEMNNSKATNCFSNEDQLILYNFIKIPTIGTIYQQREVLTPTAIDRVGAVLYQSH